MIFYMQLSLRLGRSVQELLATVSSAELTLWQAFNMREPIGDWRHDLGHGVVASVTANANRAKDAEVFQPIDFMPLSAKPKVQTWADKLRNTLKNFSSKKG
jgi:hypothetical protein